jgi:hypothetical protein
MTTQLYDLPALNSETEYISPEAVGVCPHNIHSICDLSYLFLVFSHSSIEIISKFCVRVEFTGVVFVSGKRDAVFWKSARRSCRSGILGGHACRPRGKQSRPYLRLPNY